MNGMRVFIFILIAAALAFYFFPSFSNKFSVFSGIQNQEEKCTTKAGDVYYGNVPKGIVCHKSESIDTSITIIKSVSPNVNESSAVYENSKCDGRKYCSQMKSCNEAKYFFKNCPNTSMDGNNDGIPCQKQWCNF